RSTALSPAAWPKIRNSAGRRRATSGSSSSGSSAIPGAPGPSPRRRRRGAQRARGFISTEPGSPQPPALPPLLCSARCSGAGRPQAVCDAVEPRGGSWGRDDVILFAPDQRGPLYRVSALGGRPEPVIALGPDEGSHRVPHFLPDGRRFVYLSSGSRGENRRLYT